MDGVKKTLRISVRIPEEIADALSSEAVEKKTNQDALLAQILERYFGFEANMSNAGLVSIPKPLLVKLMAELPERKVIAFAEYISQDIITDMMAVLQTEYTVESFLRVIESWAMVSKIPFRRITKGSLNTCVLQHDLGKNWSVYLGHLFKNVIEEVAQKRVAINPTENTLKIMF